MPPVRAQRSSVPAAWTREERALLARLGTPDRIQAFLDEIPYSSDPIYRSPRSVLRDRRAHCFDGALFAAAALRAHGEVPLVVDLRAVRDDDHVIAVFRRGRHLGAIAKSNYSGLRFREPIHRTVRELALSYFHDYYNLEREKTLRSYSEALDLRAFDAIGWMTRDEGLDRIAERLDTIRHRPLVSAAQVRALRAIDDRTYRAGLMGANEAGLYRAKE